MKGSQPLGAEDCLVWRSFLSVVAPFKMGLKRRTRPPGESEARKNARRFVAALFFVVAGFAQQGLGITANSRNASLLSLPQTIDPGLNGQASGETGGIPSGLGWHEIPNTRVAPVCPDVATYLSIQGADGCSAVINAWSGGIADTLRNRLILWGGGHGDYGGNELYALDLNKLEMTRLNDPSIPAASGCLAANPDGSPNARHTYGGMAYIASSDQLFAVNGSLWCSSGAGADPPDTWINSLASLKWNQVHYTGNPPGIAGGVRHEYLQFGNAADYDPNSQLVFAKDGDGVFSFNPKTSVWTKLSTRILDYHMAAVVDPVRKLFVMMGGGAANGGGIRAVDISPRSNYAIQDWNAKVSGCSALADGVYPGLAYDPVQKMIVGWTGGDEVTLFDPSKGSCTTVSYAGGPGKAPAAGTNGRFRYFPALGVYAVVNGSQENAYIL
jgi:hypothetical protein